MSLKRNALLAATLLGSTPAMADDVRAREFFHDNCLQPDFEVDGLKERQARKLTAFMERELAGNLKRPDAICMDNDPRTAISLPMNVRANDANMSSRAVVTSNDPHRACLHVAKRTIRPRDAANTEWAFLKPRFSEGDVVPFELDVNGLVDQRASEICSADGHLVSHVQGSHLASKAFARAYDEIVSTRTGIVDTSKLDGYASNEALKPGGDLLVKLDSEMGPEHTKRWEAEFDAAAQLLSAYLLENNLRFKPSDDSHELRLTLLDRAKYVDFVTEDGVDYLRRPDHNIRYTGLAVANLEWDRNGYYGTDDFTIPFATFKECRELCEEGSLTPEDRKWPTSSLDAQIPKSEMHQVIAYYMYMALQRMDALEDFDYGSLAVSGALATPVSEELAVAEASANSEEDLCAEYQGEGLKKRFRGMSVLGIGFDRNIPEVCAEKEATTAINANPNVGGVNLGIRFEIADRPKTD